MSPTSCHCSTPHRLPLSRAPDIIARRRPPSRRAVVYEPPQPHLPRFHLRAGHGRRGRGHRRTAFRRHRHHRVVAQAHHVALLGKPTRSPPPQRWHGQCLSLQDSVGALQAPSRRASHCIALDSKTPQVGNPVVEVHHQIADDHQSHDQYNVFPAEIHLASCFSSYRTLAIAASD